MGRLSKLCPFCLKQRVTCKGHVGKVRWSSPGSAVWQRLHEASKGLVSSICCWMVPLHRYGIGAFERYNYCEFTILLLLLLLLVPLLFIPMKANVISTSTLLWYRKDLTEACNFRGREGVYSGIWACVRLQVLPCAFRKDHKHRCNPFSVQSFCDTSQSNMCMI